MSDPAETTAAYSPRVAGDPKFLCDSMLARLCRRLRAAGYDSEIAGHGEHDAALLARAVDEGRLLLTCDRKMAERRLAAGRVVVLPSNGLDGTARALMDVVPIDWLLKPFSRCLVDNSRLRPATPADLDRLPPRAREIGGNDIFICPNCQRIYWPGSHVRRMYVHLQRWQGMTNRLASAPKHLSIGMVNKHG